MLTNGSMLIITKSIQLNYTSMKSNFRKVSLLLTGILVGGKLLAQSPDSAKTSTDYVKPFSSEDAFRTWSIGVSGGVLTPYTILGTKNKQDFTSPNAELGYGAYIKKQITSGFGIQADFMGGKLSANNSQVDAFGNTLDSYSTKVHYALSLSGNVTVGNISWRHNKNAIQPYVTAGAGTMHYTPVKTGNGITENFKIPDNGAINEIFVPVGAGVKINIAKGLNLDLGYQLNFVYSDNVDAFNYGSNNDRFFICTRRFRVCFRWRIKAAIGSA